MVSKKILHLYGAIKILPKLCSRHYSSQKLVIPVFKKAIDHSDRVAIRDEFGKYTYRDLLNASLKLADEITDSLEGKVQERVALLCPSNASYVIAQWACWISGQIAVPLSSSYPQSILQYLLSDSKSSLLISEPQHENKLAKLCSNSQCKPFILDPSLRESALYKPEDKTEKKLPRTDISSVGLEDSFYGPNNALIIYTSGSSGLPKGVLLSHLNIESQIKSMVESWQWDEKDCMLHTLPLNHIHGIVNALLVPLYVGARCVMMKEFEAPHVWAELVGVKIPSVDRVNLFTGVPTMYAKLVQEFDTKLNKSDRIAEHIKQTCVQRIRLMLCGSAPLSHKIFQRWQEITGHKIVERYGMTETGMVLSASLQNDRVYGNVGIPMPGMEVRLVSTERDGSKKIVASGTREGTKIYSDTKFVEPESAVPAFRSLIAGPSYKQAVTGVLHVSGDGVASKYWNKPQASASDFKSGWFNTGDIVEYCNGKYTIMGRLSSDIIKTGGYKVSAIQVETVLAEYEGIADVAVVPLEDPVWGEKIGAVVVMKADEVLDLEELKRWASERLPDYALPRVVLEAPDGSIPRNAMGKLNRQQIREEVFSQHSPETASASG